MKRIIASLICSALAVGGAVANPITPSKAMLIAKRVQPQGELVLQRVAKYSQEFLQKVNAGTVSKANRVAGTQGNSASGNDVITEENAPYYIISCGEGRGFIIVSGDDCIPEVIGIVEQGDYDETDMPESFKSWLKWRAEQVEYAQANGLNNTSYQRKVAAGRVDVPYLIKALWHQSTPYNDKCPVITSSGSRALTGCVATATSQIAYYWKRDCSEKLLSTTPTYNDDNAPITSQFVIKKNTPLKWELMQDQVSSGSPQEFKDAVSTLCAAVGMAGHLDYGESTAGQISDMVAVLQNYLGLKGGTCIYKNPSGVVNYTEAGWSQLLYNELINNRPVLYCGNNNTNGGHAVVCDGYQASTGYFHINFGWGANYNGYFSVEDGATKGWGFNDGWQGCVYGIQAKNPNVDVNVEVPEHVYRNVDSQFSITVENKGTLPCKGIYLFLSTSSSAPTALKNAKSSYLTEIPCDGKAEFKLTGKVTTAGNYYALITDGNLNLLQKVKFTSEKSEGAISLKNLTIASSADNEEFNGEKYNVVYNTSTTVTAHILKLSDVPFYGGLQLKVFGYNTANSAWDNIGVVAVHPTITGTEGTADFLLTATKLSLSAGKYYYAELSDTINTLKDKVQLGDDNMVRFTIKANDLQVAGFENNVLAMKGHWDPTTFKTKAVATAYSSATSYDLTQCTGVTAPSVESKPNALFYVADDADVEGTNIIKGGHCQMLKLTQGYDFAVQEGVKTDASEITLDMEPAKWYFLTTPVKLTVPQGMAAREINGHFTSATGLINKTTDITELEAGKTYLVMTSSSRHLTLTGSQSDVAPKPVANKDTMIIGTYVNTETPAGGVMLDNQDPQQYLTPVAEETEVQALGGYLLDPKVKVSLKTYKSNVYDPQYIQLAKDITTAWETLDKYEKKASAEAYSALLEEIKKAEEVFTYRTDTKIVKSTYEELETACSDFLMQQDASVEVDADCTALITNPSFELKNTSGWTLSSTTGSAATSGVNVNMFYSVGLDGSYIFKSLIAADSSSVAISQNVANLQPGYYRLEAKVGTSIGRTVTLFAGDSTVTVPAHDYGMLYLRDAMIDNIEVKADEGSDKGSLEIGIKAGDWYKADDFRLTYLHALPNNIKGDVNGDGTVDISDVNAVIAVICGNSLAPEGEAFVEGQNAAGERGLADVNEDGTVDISDVNFVIGIICGGE